MCGSRNKEAGGLDRETQLGLWIPRKTSINDLSPSGWGGYYIAKLYKIKMGDFNVKNKTKRI